MEKNFLSFLIVEYTQINKVFFTMFLKEATTFKKAKSFLKKSFFPRREEKKKTVFLERIYLHPRSGKKYLNRVY